MAFPRLSSSAIIRSGDLVTDLGEGEAPTLRFRSAVKLVLLVTLVALVALVALLLVVVVLVVVIVLVPGRGLPRDFTETPRLLRDITGATQTGVFRRKCSSLCFRLAISASVSACRMLGDFEAAGMAGAARALPRKVDRGSESDVGGTMDMGRVCVGVCVAVTTLGDVARLSQPPWLRGPPCAAMSIPSRVGEANAMLSCKCIAGEANARRCGDTLTGRAGLAYLKE